MNSLEARIAQCKELQRTAICIRDFRAFRGYVAEQWGMADARDGRPCDPDSVYVGYEHRYRRGYEDAQTLLKLEERASVGA